VFASEGRILVMTTNHPEKLDPALIRDGRVDYTVKFENADSALMAKMFTALLRVPLPGRAVRQRAISRTGYRAERDDEAPHRLILALRSPLWKR
jgi:ATP-dependent 26S proteasome regulatory subunit